MDVRLPRLGEGADSGTVASIFVKAGDQVMKDQPILELESEKAVASIPSPAAGTVATIDVKEGEVIKVGSLLLTLTAGEGGRVASPPPRFDATVGDELEDRPGPAQMPAPLPEATQALVQQVPPGGMPPGGLPQAASPSLRKTARELGIDLARVRGSERGGRIVLADVRRYIESLQAAAFTARCPRTARSGTSPGSGPEKRCSPGGQTSTATGRACPAR